MNQKKLNEQLLKIAQKQQEIIEKLAQKLQMAPQKFEPVKPELHEGEVILAALPANIKGSVAGLDVKPSTDPAYSNEALVKFHPGKGSDMAFNSIMATIGTLQKANKLTGRNYKLTEVA